MLSPDSAGADRFAKSTHAATAQISSNGAPGEFEKGHMLGDVKHQLQTPCDECHQEEELIRRVEELQQQLERIKQKALAHIPWREEGEGS